MSDFTPKEVEQAAVIIGWLCAVCAIIIAIAVYKWIIHHG